MSDEKPQAEPAKKGLPIKTMLFVFLALAVEAGVIVTVMMVLGRPAEVQAITLSPDEAADLERLREVPVLHEKFTNSRQGRVWIWDTEIIVQVKELHADGVTAEIEERRALIRTGVSRIIAGAQHVYFNEPGRETLGRQITEFLNAPDVIGPDAEGEPRIESVLIPSCIGFPADY